MCKKASLSRYQKRVVKFLTDFCGTIHPFSYEKAQNNHLKVLIAGVPKPLYTGSTPSDRKSLNNFMAEVKRAIRESQTITEEVKPVKKPQNKMSHTVSQYLDKLTQAAIKTLRKQANTLKAREEEAVLEQRSTDAVELFRSQLIKKRILQANSSQCNRLYLKQNDFKVMGQSIRKHLDFTLPTLAYYGELLDESKTKAESPKLVEENKLKPAIKTAERPKSVKKISTINDESKSKKASVKDLGLTKIEGRVERLREMSKEEALALIEDINTAIRLNREADIAQVVALIKEKGLFIDEIAQSINKFAA
jgi:hypothetical protein